VSGVRLSLTFAGLRRERPPKTLLSFDVALRNDEPERRWAMLPTTVPRNLGAARRHASSIDIYELGGAVVARFLGDEAFATVLVPASAGITLRRFPFAHWGGEPPGAVEIELVTARALLVDGRPLEDRADRDLTSAAGADVDAGPLADQRSVVESIDPPAGATLSVQWVDPRTTRQRATCSEAG